jgi:hypothetical protein
MIEENKEPARFGNLVLRCFGAFAIIEFVRGLLSEEKAFQALGKGGKP